MVSKFTAVFLTAKDEELNEALNSYVDKRPNLSNDVFKKVILSKSVPARVTSKRYIIKLLMTQSITMTCGKPMHIGGNGFLILPRFVSKQ